MFTQAKHGNSFNIAIHEYYCDEIKELEQIEKKYTPPMGSSCFCFEDKGVYLMSGKGKFVKV